MKSVLILEIFCILSFVSAENDENVNGKSAILGQFPYVSAMKNRGGKWCGSSIISNTTIITAASCIYGHPIEELTVNVGIIDEYDYSTSDRFEKAILHPLYNHSNYHVHNLAILKLSTPLKFGRLINKIPLKQSKEFDSKPITAAGFGFQGWPVEGSDRLRYAELIPLERNKCQKLLPGIKVNDGDFCTNSHVETGRCGGDAGDPLVDSQGQLIGVVSRGIACVKGSPDVFTWIPYYYDWIMTNL